MLFNHDAAMNCYYSSNSPEDDWFENLQMAFTGLNCDFSFKTYYAKFLL